MEDKEGWKKQADHFRLVGGGFNKEEVYLEQPPIIRSPGSHSLDQLSKLIMA